ncbi:A24 family peptidase [Candidatus Pacearchaeota archaeon]|nr:A24 family peptidase [Candidatus Pacearchaeota archaeon]
MYEYCFLFGLALLWILWATIQDLRSREVSNWLNFSLVAFAIAYRAFYSIFTKDFGFFLWGLAGFALFFGLAYAFYYARAFAGGDAKLLMGIGIVLPFASLFDLWYLSLIFIFLLFFLGALYSLIYSIYIVWNNRKNFKMFLAPQYALLVFVLGIALVINGILYAPSFWLKETLSVAGLILCISMLYLYLKALERCMIKRISPEKLTEGDWLHQDVKVGKHVIKKSVHGLSWKDIRLLRKFNKSVLIKEGIPFVPAFFLAFLVMVFFWATSRLDLSLLAAFVF